MRPYISATTSYNITDHSSSADVEYDADDDRHFLSFFDHWARVLFLVSTFCVERRNGHRMPCYISLFPLSLSISSSLSRYSVHTGSSLRFLYHPGSNCPYVVSLMLGHCYSSRSGLNGIRRYPEPAQVSIASIVSSCARASREY